MKNSSFCPLCSAGNSELFWPHCWNSRKIKVFRCGNCGVIFLNPMMGDAASAEYYKNYVGHLARRGVASRETPEQTYLRRKKGTAYRFKIVNRYLGKKLSALEIGGGCGNFIGEIHAARKIAQASLLESCRWHLEFTKKKFGIQCFRSISEISGMKFDRIFMFHTFEHIRDPHEFLKMIYSLLSSYGLLILEVPCSADPLLSVYNCSAYKDFYFQPMHNFVYAEKSLRMLFGRHGFSPVRFIYLQRYTLANHLSWLSNEKVGTIPGIQKILSPKLEKKYKLALKRGKFTDTIFAVFKIRL